MRKSDRHARHHGRIREPGMDSIWLFGLHAVRHALSNPAREKLRLVLTKNALNRLSEVVRESGMVPEIADARKFPAPLDPASVHQGAALEVKPLDWGALESLFPDHRSLVVLCLDRVTDPHNVGAILRSAEVFGASAVVAPQRHSAPETGALAKSASGALERVPYVRVRNLASALEDLREHGFFLIGLDGEADGTLEAALAQAPAHVALVLGAEGQGLRMKTRTACDRLARIGAVGGFDSLNVSNASAVALYAAAQRRKACVVNET
ncbi:MAG: 23S rRNA (guanosine(2251)-2'-O)-methyltransferase RlmB [Boseongicola sp. SB0670_bin_30]|nr:23S rRNA (guanosine(2251)-2'-O)-methyltransferase RlmB [Boseongicola sp. SB0670_bin_30]